MQNLHMMNASQEGILLQWFNGLYKHLQFFKASYPNNECEVTQLVALISSINVSLSFSSQ